MPSSTAHSSTAHSSAVDETDGGVDLWLELSRLVREDRLALARRREDIRRHRQLRLRASA